MSNQRNRTGTEWNRLYNATYAEVEAKYGKSSVTTTAIRNAFRQARIYAASKPNAGQTARVVALANLLTARGESLA
jgi:hypothetical protein